MEKTRGELLLEGLATVRQGLEMIGQAGSGRSDMVRLLATSNSGAQQLRELLKGPGLLHQMVIGMVGARNSQLSPKTVDKVIGDFLAVLEDLAQPVEMPTAEQKQRPQVRPDLP